MGVKCDWRRREQRAGIVDDSQASQRGGARRELRPEAKDFEDFERRSEQRDGAAVTDAGLGFAAADDPVAGAGEADRRRQPGKPCAEATEDVTQRTPDSECGEAIAPSWHACFLAVQASAGQGRMEQDGVPHGMHWSARYGGAVARSPRGSCRFISSRPRAPASRFSLSSRRSSATFPCALPGSGWRCSSTGSTARWRASRGSAKPRLLIDGATLDLVVDFPRTYVVTPVVAFHWRSDLTPSCGSRFRWALLSSSRQSFISPTGA